MLMPKRTKYRKQQRGRMNGTETRGTDLKFGDFGLQALEPAWITARQLEAARRAMTRSIRRGGQVWIRVFPDKPVTSRPAETRMGSGKGAPEFWVAVVKPGRVLFEIQGVDEPTAREAMRLAGNKLPIKTTFLACSSLPMIGTGGEPLVPSAVDAQTPSSQASSNGLEVPLSSTKEAANA